MAKGIKTGGRRKGTPNKVSGTVKEMITQVISKELESLPNLMTKLEPKEKLDAIVKLIPYLIPKASREDEQIKTPAERQNELVSHIVRQMNINKAKQSNSG